MLALAASWTHEWHTHASHLKSSVQTPRINRADAPCAPNPNPNATEASVRTETLHWGGYTAIRTKAFRGLAVVPQSHRANASLQSSKEPKKHELKTLACLGSRQKGIEEGNLAGHVP